MKKTILCLALVVSCAASAQILNVLSVEKVATPQTTDCRVTGMSPDGSYILLTSTTNKGLQKYDLQTGEISVITENEGAGYNPQIAADGNDIVYRETTLGSDKLRRSTLLRHSLVNSKKEVLVKDSRNLEGYTIHGGTILAVNKRQLKTAQLGKTKAEPAPVLSINNGQLMITRNGQTSVLSPNGQDKSYIWPSVSPDGRHICYYVCGVGCYVSDIDGSNVKFIARDCRAAKWYNDNVLVAMADKDNGEFVTESAVVAYTLDGKQQILTPNSIIAMYPYASANGEKIVCSTYSGETYLITVSK